MLESHASTDVVFDRTLRTECRRLLQAQAELDELLTAVFEMGSCPAGRAPGTIIPRGLAEAALVTNALATELERVGLLHLLGLDFCRKLASSVCTSPLAIYVIAATEIPPTRSLACYSLVKTCLASLSLLEDYTMEMAETIATEVPPSRSLARYSLVKTCLASLSLLEDYTMEMAETIASESWGPA